MTTRHAYEIVPSSDSATIRTPPTANSLREARRIAAGFRNMAWKAVRIWRDDEVILAWARSPEGKGRRWHRVNP